MGNKDSKQQPEVKEIKASELQTYVMVIQAKLTQQRNKKTVEISKKRVEIINYLRDNNLEVAKLKMEGIIREEDYISAFDILSFLCEAIKEKVSYLLFHQRCPDDMRSYMDTLVFASSRVEIDEFQKFRDLVRIKYGEKYIEEANSNAMQLVNVNVIQKLMIKPIPDPIIISRLKQICKQENLNFVFPQLIEEMNPDFNAGIFNNYPQGNDPSLFNTPVQPNTNFNPSFPQGNQMPDMGNYPSTNFNPNYMPNPNLFEKGMPSNNQFPNSNLGQPFDPNQGNPSFNPNQGNQPFNPNQGNPMGNQPFNPNQGNPPFNPNQGNQPFNPNQGNQIGNQPYNSNSQPMMPNFDSNPNPSGQSAYSMNFPSTSNLNPNFPSTTPNLGGNNNQGNFDMGFPNTGSSKPNFGNSPDDMFPETKK